MKIGIDISQLAHEGTGVENYLINLIKELVKNDKENEYVLFFSSMRKKFPISNFQFLNKSQNPNVQIKNFRLPPRLLDIIWNKMHIFPIEWFIGDIDVFISSDWTEPPVVRAKKITILYDLIIYKHPEETDREIIQVQKRKLRWAVKECKRFLCISSATKKDAMEILGLPEEKISVVYPGF